MEAKDGTFLITKPHLMVCEGPDDYRFLRNLIGYYIDSRIMPDSMHIVYAEGKDNIKFVIRDLHLRPGFELLKSITVVRDADDDPSAAIQSLQSTLGSNGYAVPRVPCVIQLDGSSKHKIASAFVLFPEFNSLTAKGDLEELCLHILSDEIDYNVLEKAAITVESVSGLKKRSKNRLYTIFSLTNEYVSLKLGEAAKANAYNFSSPLIEPFKKLLLYLLEV